MSDRLVIFDCDGVLVDSEGIANEVLADALGETGLVMSAGEAEDAFTGATMDAVIEEIEARGHPLPADFVARYLALLHERLERELEPIPGVADLLESLDGPRCVASNGEPESTWLSLRTTGLLHHFEPHVFNARQVGRGKPHPDLFLHAARMLGAAPDVCVVIEDSPRGITAARAAGMRALGYAPNTGPKRDHASRLKDAGAHAIVNDMRALPDFLAG